jgi:uncharacterized membrane protein YjjP (DUF1212 family)
VRTRALGRRAPVFSNTTSSASRLSVTSSVDRENKAASAAYSDAVDVLLWFGTSMLRAGNSAIRTREWMEVMARKMGFDAVSVSLTLDSVIASVRRSGEWATAMREIGPAGVNAWRIGELEQLAKTVGPGLAPREIAARLAKIDSAPPRYSAAQTWV